MIQAHRLSGENIDRIQALYQEFAEQSRTEYSWDHDPVVFDALKSAVTNRIVHGYWVEDTGRATPEIAFMLYTIEDYRAIEVNIIYTRPGAELKTVTDRLMRQFIKDIKAEPGWDVVSYAMLGRQGELVHTLPWYGFKPVGQAIVKFEMADTLSVQIMKQQQLGPLPEGYTLDFWKPEYEGETAQSILEAFENATDSCWDPRFRTLGGAKKVIAMMTSDMMGQFMPECTSILLKNGTPVGFCFMLQTDVMDGNIPLIGVRPSEKKQGLGNQLLKHSLDAVVDGFVAAKNTVMNVSATLDTDNIAAIKMYRRMGCRDVDNYGHAYLTREKAESMIVGKWC